MVANAGIERIGTVRGQPPEDFERVIEVNLLGVYRTLQPARIASATPPCARAPISG